VDSRAVPPTTTNATTTRSPVTLAHLLDKGGVESRLELAVVFLLDSKLVLSLGNHTRQYDAEEAVREGMAHLVAARVFATAADGETVAQTEHAHACLLQTRALNLELILDLVTGGEG